MRALYVVHEIDTVPFFLFSGNGLDANGYFYYSIVVNICEISKFLEFNNFFNKIILINYDAFSKKKLKIGRFKLSGLQGQKIVVRGQGISRWNNFCFTNVAMIM